MLGVLHCLKLSSIFASMASQALLKAISAGRVRQVRLLLESNPCCVNDADDCGQTALIRAIFLQQEFSRDKILLMLLKRGAVVSKADVVGRNALAWACLYGRFVNVEQLLENADIDLDINKGDINGQTPLFHAVSSGCASTVKLMVDALNKYSLSVDVQDFYGTSPLMLAIRLNHDVCESILVLNGNAKVGLGMKHVEDFNRAEKWAVHTMRKRNKVKNTATYTKFPSLNFQGTKQSNLRLHLPVSDSDLDSDSSSSEDEESCVDSTNSFSINFDENVPRDDKFNYCMKFAPKFGIPASLLAVSPSLSTVANASSEDEVDMFSVPLEDGKSKKSSTQCLGQFFNIVQDQMTTSFRRTACRPPPPPLPPSKEVSFLPTDRSDVNSKPTKKGNKVMEKLKKIKCVTKRHTVGNMSGSPTFLHSSCSGHSPRMLERGTTFPLLANKRTDMVKNSSEMLDGQLGSGINNNNYSLM